MRGIMVRAIGGPEVLEYDDVPDPDPGPEEIGVDVAAAGLNYIDTYHRTGLYPVALPFTPGLEGAGTVVAVGDNVDTFAVGDAVAWSTGLGSYAERVAIPASMAVPVPSGVDLELAAAVPLQGFTAHYLTTDTYPLAPGDRCLVHAGAGGVGLLLIQMAKLRGAEVFTTVGSPAKAERATAAGADHVILYRDVDFADAVVEIAGQRPLDVVYDGVGQATFAPSLGLLRRRGLMVTYGNASGPVEPVSPLVLSSNGSIFLTRPTLFDHVVGPGELDRRAADVFGWVADGSVEVHIDRRLPLADAAEAHRLLESRATIGKVLLVP